MMQSTRRDFMKYGALSAAASTMFFSREVFTDYEAQAEESGNDVVLRCCVMSDVHFNGSESDKEVERFKRAIKFMYDYSAAQPYKNFDALVVCGDMSNRGIAQELNLFKKTMDEAIKPGTEKFLCMGNHEFYGGSQAFWKSVFGVEPNRHYEIKGYRFIAVSPEHGSKENGGYLYAIDYLKKELAEAYAQDPKKPIFVFQHYPVSPTVYGGRGFDDWGAEDMFDTLQAYPTVVDFAGHTHYPINDPRCAWQGNFSAFGTGTLSYLCHGHEGFHFQKYFADDGNYGQFYVMEVRSDNSVTLKPYDLATNSFFDIVYYVGEPGAVDKYTYTDKRYYESERPTWGEGTKVELSFDEPYYAKIEFPQAHCKDVVAGYRVELEKLDAKTNKRTPFDSYYFWSRYYLRNMPEKAVGDLDNLDPNAKYFGKVYALNPFMRESEEALTFEFTSPNDPGADADRDSAEPRANFYDLHVVDGKVVNTPSADWTKDREWKPVGKGKVVKDKELNADVLELSGDGCYETTNVDADYKKLRRMTIGGKFRVDGDVVGSNCVLSNTQEGGVAITYNAPTKSLRLWVCVNGGYRTLDAKIPLEKYVTAYGTYDGRSIVFYVNGKEVAREFYGGKITYTNDPTAKRFCFGGDPEPNGGHSCLFKGRVAYAKLFTWALTPEQIANISK